jgi:hypothetical protein
MQPTPPPSGSDKPLSAEAVTKLIQEQGERDRKWLEFAQTQGRSDRDYFKHIFDRTYWFIAVLVAAIGIGGSILGFRSVQQIRDEAKLTVDGEVAKVQAELQRMKVQVDDSAVDAKRKVQEQLDSAHTEVIRRVDQEFKTDQITTLVQAVAKQKTEQELNGVIRREVVNGIQQQSGTIQKTVESEAKKAVKELEPTIATIVKSETEGQINKAVEPVRVQMQTYGNTINFTTLATLAKNGDRKSFDTLNNRASYASMPDMLPLGTTIVTDIVREYENTLRMGREFNETVTPDQMKDFLEQDIDVSTRLTALDKFPAGDHSIVPILIRVIQNDSSLAVVYTSFLVLNRETKQKFVFPDYASVTKWWNENKDSWK